MPIAEIDKHAPRFRWVDLATVDQSAARSFYCGLFGWSAQDQHANNGSFCTFTQANAPVASLYQLSRKQIQYGVPSHWTPYVCVPDADFAALKVLDLGGQVIVPPQDVAGLARVGLICDPSGALIGLWQEPPAGEPVPVTPPSERIGPRMIDVAVVLLNDNFTSTAIGPIEVFHAAGSLWQVLKGEPPKPRFRVTIASLDGKSVISPYSLQLLPQVSLRTVKRTDIVVVPASGLDLDHQFRQHRTLFPWLRRMATQGALIAGCCTGSAYLAEAGLLDGREATTHWATADHFARRYPKVDWRPDKLITEDRRMLCSGGVYSSMDLSLYLVEKFCGHEVALQCAKSLLINMPRPSQSGYAVLPLSRPHDDEKVRTAETYMEKNFGRDVSIEGLARKLNMSPRNFMRRFKSATGRLPGSYLQAVRVAVAKEMLEDGARSVRAVGAAVGYDDAAFFRNVFKRCTGMTPGEYRDNFSGISSAHPHSKARAAAAAVSAAL